MQNRPDFAGQVRIFNEQYDGAGKDAIWTTQSQRFRNFWNTFISHGGSGAIPDEDCDSIIRILDRNGKGNTKASEAVAKAMIAQGAWRRMLNEFRSNQNLGGLITRLLNEPDPGRKAELIDELYRVNAGQRNYLTGPSGNAVCAYLAAWDPANNLSIISLSDRQAVIEALSIPLPADWQEASIGRRIIWSNQAIRDAGRSIGLTGSARATSTFFYVDGVKRLWKGSQTVKRDDEQEVVVTIPTRQDEDQSEDEALPRESMIIQGLIAKIGVAMGFKIWLPRADRSRVLQAWRADAHDLVDELPLGFDATTTKTVEQIDVLWLKRRSIVRAFEVEHTTSIYSGLLRMADLVALQPNIQVDLHIVAPDEKREKVLQEIQRPVFSLLEGRALSKMCSYLSYESIRELAEFPHLSHLSHEIIDDEFAEHAE